jgi:hypothetical protein
MIKTEILAETAQAVAGTSRHGSRIERTQMVLRPQEIAIAMVIDFLTARGDGETRNVTIGAIEEGREEAIEVTDVGIKTETNGRNASQSGWKSPRRTRAKFTRKKTFRSGRNKCKERTKLARRL